MQKGVHSGEITMEVAGEPKHRLHDTELFSAPVGCETSQFPEEFVDYSKRARELFAKIVRYDRILFEGDTSEPNPVHDMINKLGEL